MKPRELTEEEKEELRMQFHKKKKLTKEEIKLKQLKIKSKVESIGYFLITMFFLVMLIASLYVLYLMLTYQM